VEEVADLVRLVEVEVVVEEVLLVVVALVDVAEEEEEEGMLMKALQLRWLVSCIILLHYFLFNKMMVK
jgi:hypothetical protein